MRKPINEDEALQFYSAWKGAFRDAFNAHTKAALEQSSTFVLDTAREVVENAAMAADCALEKMVEKFDEIKAAQ